MSKINIGEKIEEAKKSFKSYRLDMSFGELMNIYEAGDLIISPSYQRSFRWNVHQRTCFIESLLVGIPIPTIFVAENHTNKWEIVDGVQRLSTFFSFFGKLKGSDENFWKMKKAKLIPELNRLTCKDLPVKSQLKLKRVSCSVEIIEYQNDDYNTRYELFNRLNTGGTPLSGQEIRNVIYRSISDNFNSFLTEYGNKPKFKKIINITKKKEEALYLEELILRFCSLYNNIDNVKGNLYQYMNTFMGDMVKKSKDDSSNINEFKDILDRTIELLCPLGPDIFRVNNSKVFSTSYYDGIMVGVSQNIDYYETHPETLLTNIEEMKESKEFKSYTGSASHNTKKVVGRLETANKIFEKK